VTLCACGGGENPDDHESVPPTTIVSVTTPVLDTVVDLQTSQSTTYYTVTGTTTEDIFASIEANGPTDNVGQQGSGLTSVDWEYKWSGDQDPTGACSIRDMTISAIITVELPQHEDETSLTDSLRTNWDKYAAGVATHEQHHVDIYLQGAEDIRDAMEAIGVEPSCEALETHIDSIWGDEQTRINGLQQAFHSDENARLEAARGPLEQQIDANRDQLASLQSQIDGLDSSIAGLRSEISVFDKQVASIDAQIKQINDQFPNDLPKTIRDRLESLIDQSNELLVTYNQKVDEHNSAIYQRNTLSDQYDQLLTETNQLVDQYNWTR
jgi:predicted secreted Zn-dependent protease